VLDDHRYSVGPYVGLLSEARSSRLTREELLLRGLQKLGLELTLLVLTGQWLLVLIREEVRAGR